MVPCASSMGPEGSNANEEPLIVGQEHNGKTSACSVVCTLSGVYGLIWKCNCTEVMHV